ncbi:MAG: hypothetical protein CMD18_06730 [Flavobacteriales bacterium]|nr:hypothetical protein [Flavobacteriales bacterium]
MRFLLSSTFIFFITLNTFSQAWIDCGIKGGYGVTSLVNGNVWNESKIDPLISTGYAFGGKLGLNFNINYQITVDFLGKSSNQRYLFEPSETRSAREKNIRYNTFDIPFLFRHNSDNGSFLEIGPQVSFLTSVFETNDNIDKKSSFESTNFGAVLGFGSFIFGGDNAYLVFGLRFHYGFQDLLSKEGGRGSKEYYLINNKEMDVYESDFQFNNYQPTNPISGLVYLEFNYDLAYLVTSSCKRSVIRFF